MIFSSSAGDLACTNLSLEDFLALPRTAALVLGRPKTAALVLDSWTKNFTQKKVFFFLMQSF
ncbi:MAG: hypothetical protein RIR51_1364 [Bacteroidota bacterium]|jgi:hypothetical protein